MQVAHQAIAGRLDQVQHLLKTLRAPVVRVGHDLGACVGRLGGHELAQAPHFALHRRVGRALRFQQGQVVPAIQVDGQDAATPLALLESSRYVRDAALSRAVGARSPQDDDSQATGAWVQAIGGSGKLDGDANTARTQSNTSGLLVGIDRDIGGWQLGLLLGNGRTDTKQAQGRSAKARIDNTHVGLYAGHSWGAFGLRGGIGYSRHDIDSSRQVAFAGYSDGLNANYDAKTKQAFIEAGYRFGGKNPEAGLDCSGMVAYIVENISGRRLPHNAAQIADRAIAYGIPGVRAPFRFSGADLSLDRPAPKLGEHQADLQD